MSSEVFEGGVIVTTVVVPLAIVALALIGVEALRWMLRPEARRLRALKKIGGRR